MNAAARSERAKKAAATRWNGQIAPLEHAGGVAATLDAQDAPEPRKAACRKHRLGGWVLACPACNPEAPAIVGELPPDWKKIRRGVMVRDGFKCKHCGSRERLSVNHIVARPVGNHDPRNLVTLCDTCHDAVEMPAEVASV